MASLVANGLATLAARLLVPVFSFAIGIAVARLGGSALLGQYVELVAIALVAQTLAGAGLPPLVTREVAARGGHAGALLPVAYRLGLSSGALASLLFALYVALVVPAAQWSAAAWLALSIVPSAWIGAQEGVLMGVQRHPRLAAVACAEGAVKLAAAGIVLASGGGLVGLCAGVTLGRVVALVLGHRLVRSARAEAVSDGGAADAPGAFSALARELVPFAATVTLAMLYFRQDVMVVGALRSEGETGLYGVAATLYAMTLLLPNAAMAAIYPRLAAAFVLSPAGFRAATLRTTGLLVGAGAAVALVLVLVAAPLVRLLYGPAFEGAVPVLRLLAALLPLHGANAALGQAMQAARLQRAMLAMTAVTVVANLAALLVLVPRYGIEGAAVALLASTLLAIGIQAVIFQRQFGRRALAAADASGAQA